MKKIASTLVALAMLTALLDVSEVSGQQINVGTPFNSASSSFHENFGVNFGFSLAGGRGPGSRIVGLSPGGQLTPNINFTQNLSGGTIPAFGGFDPGSGARFGFRAGRPGGSGFSLGFNFAQGSSRTLSSATPSITLPNGGFGTFQSGFLTPFVTGVTPVVGNYHPDNAVTRAISSGQLRPYSQREAIREEAPATSSGTYSARSFSSAERGDIGVAEIKAQKSRARALRLQNFEQAVRDAKIAEESEAFRDARNHLRAAIKLTDDKQRQKQLKAWLDRLRSKR